MGERGAQDAGKVSDRRQETEAMTNYKRKRNQFAFTERDTKTTPTQPQPAFVCALIEHLVSSLIQAELPDSCSKSDGAGPLGADGWG